MAEQRVGSYGDVERPAGPFKVIPVPGPIRRRIDRGRNQMKRDASKRRLCQRFTRGDTWLWLDERGLMQSTPTVTFVRGGGKPPHRSRKVYNFIGPIVEDKVSSATQRIPNYEVDPATTDPEDAGAAKVSEKVSTYGYDQWRVRAASIDTVKTAIGGGGSACALPYFEPNVGPYTYVDGKWIGQGEIRIKVFNGNEFYWEAGCKFEVSPWWATEQAQPIDAVKKMPGYVGGELTPDAATSDIPNDRHPDEAMVMVTDFYERPCPEWPDGRWFTIANGRVIVDARKFDPTAEYPWQPYPLIDTDGSILDEPLLHRLVYTHDPENENDFGLTWQLIDFQRTLQDCLNKMVEYKNRGLNLQMLAPINSLIDHPDDVPNSIRYYKLSPNGEKPEWEKAPDAQILSALIQIFNIVLDQMHQVSAYEDIHADPNVAARTTAAVIERSIARWQSFLGDLAEWHSRLMRHCLLLVARYYTEPRLIEVRGRMGWESIEDFKGAHLLGQTNVRVFPGSLEYLSRAQIMGKVQFYATMGWVTKEQAMMAIENGQAEYLTESHNLDVAKVNRVVRKIRDGTIMQMPTRVEMIDQTNPLTGVVEKVPTEVPAWMPSDFDDVPTWQQELSMWMKTEDYENSPPQAQEVARLMWQGLQEIQRQQAVRNAQQMQALASGQGLGNAAKPQLPQMPSQPSINGPGPQTAPQPSPEGP